MQLQGNPAASQHEEPVGRLALAEQVRARPEPRRHRVAFDQLDRAGAQLLQERGAGAVGGSLWHGQVSDPASAAGGGTRSAAASSVMSMPTGHQAMQRPHPTQPEVPNWSYQEASLWVAH